MTENAFLGGRLLLVAFEGWNDAGEAATNALRLLRDQLEVAPLTEVDAEEYFDFQFNRPTVSMDDEGKKVLLWPGATIYGPDTALSRALGAAGGADGVGAAYGDDEEEPDVYLLIGTEPSRNWRAFTAEIISTAVAEEVTGIVLIGAMLADVPHTRPISIYTTSENPLVRAELDVERSTYEGPVGILSVIADAAEQVGIPAVSVWASVPHYVHNAPSPKATLAILDRLEELIDVGIDRGDLAEESAAWESGIDALAGEDDDMAGYIQQLEQARDTVDSPEASGEAIAQEFERYLRKRGDGPTEPWRRPDN